MKKIITLSLMLIGPALGAHEVKIPKQSWGFQKILGAYDRASLQRGFQVYKEVCAACHSLHHLSYRNLKDLGYKDAEIKAIAAQVTVQDGPNDAGDMFDRPGKPSDRFVSPFKNEQAARAANNGAYPPDLSLIAKARKSGPDYLYALLTGYQAAPAGFQLQPNMHYNVAFPGHQIAMTPPLTEGQVTFADKTPATVEQMARDVTQFLAWAADPHMEDRKRLGLAVMVYLAIFTVLMYIAMGRIWAKVK